VRELDDAVHSPTVGRAAKRPAGAGDAQALNMRSTSTQGRGSSSPMR
jgi:hypothetical protein